MKVWPNTIIIIFRLQNDYFDHKIGQNAPSKCQNLIPKIRIETSFIDLLRPKMTLSEGQNLTKNLDFRGNLSTFRAENTPKSGPSKSKNNAQTLLKLLQNNFEKVQKTFLTTKNRRKWPWNIKSGSDFQIKSEISWSFINR